MDRTLGCLQDGEVLPVVVLPKSATGSVGVITSLTTRSFAALRAGGCKVALVTGARTSTLLGRLPYLPRADAYVCE